MSASPAPLWFRIDLVDDVILSAKASTSGDHETLDRIPATTLMGLVAAGVYADPALDPWPLVHGGAVRPTDAFPLAPDGTPAFPMPRCLHAAKGKTGEAANAVNLSVADKAGVADLQQMRQGFLTPAGGRVSVRTRALLKTALDRRTGKAADSQLFGYEAIRAGQSFVFALGFADSVSPELRSRIEALLVGMRRLGRSRRAEFGRVTISRYETPTIPIAPMANEEARIWLLTDLRLLDEAGFPRLRPEGADFGLPGARLVPDRSFVHVRRYAPFIARFNARDGERVSLGAGSVLTFTGAGPRTGGLVYAAGGLAAGWAYLDPPLLATGAATLSRPKIDAVVIGAEPPGLLGAWTSRRLARIDDPIKRQEWTRAFVTRMMKAYDSASAYAATENASAAPTRTQWAEVMNTAERAGDIAGFRKRFFEERTSPLQTDKAWGVATAPGATFASEFTAALAELEAKGAAAPLKILSAAAKDIAVKIGRRTTNAG